MNREVEMAVIELIVNGTITRLRATEDFNCSCCNADGKNGEQGVIKTGELFAYVNYYSQYVLKCSGEFVIPYAYRTRKTLYMNPKKFKKYVKIHRICANCADTLLLLMNLSRLNVFPTGVSVPIKTSPIYYTKISCSEKKYICACCGEEIPKDSAYVRFGIHQTGCTCLKCFKVFEYLE
jgi:hypothetical protein